MMPQGHARDGHDIYSLRIIKIIGFPDSGYHPLVALCNDGTVWRGTWAHADVLEWTQLEGVPND